MKDNPQYITCIDYFVGASLLILHMTHPPKSLRIEGELICYSKDDGDRFKEMVGFSNFKIHWDNVNTVPSVWLSIDDDIRGNFNGMILDFYDNQQLSAIRQFTKNSFDGRQAHFFENGKLICDHFYVMDRLEGEYIGSF